MTRDEVEKAAKRHAWSDRPPSVAYEAGFIQGVAWLIYEINEKFCGDEWARDVMDWLEIVHSSPADAISSGNSEKKE